MNMAQRFQPRTGASKPSIKAKKPATKKLEMAQIRIDGGTQSRWQCDAAVVDEYAEAIEAGAAFPPVTVFYDGAEYWLADGFHRFAAHSKCGKSKISVEVRQGTRREAVLHSVGANDTHGLRRSNSDKRCAVCCLLNDPEWSQWSDREIARHCRVGPPLVAKVRADMAPHLKEITDSRTVERGGTTYSMDTSSIGKKPGGDDDAPAAKDQRRKEREDRQAENDRQQQAARDALPQNIKDREQAKAEWRARSQVEQAALGAADRVAELEEAIRVLEAENAALKAENKLYSEMKVEFEKGGFAEVIAGKDAVIRDKDARIAEESQEKVRNLRRGDYFLGILNDTYHHFKDATVDPATGEVNYV